MFYATIYKGALNFHVNRVPDSAEINDDFENRFFYHYDEKRNKIVKKQPINYTVEEKDGEAIVTFDIKRDIYINVKLIYNGEVKEQYGCMYYNGDGDGLKFNIGVSGVIMVESAMEDHMFIPIIIDSEDRISDDPQPMIEIRNNTVHVQPHPYYLAIKELQEEIKKLKGE